MIAAGLGLGALASPCETGGPLGSGGYLGPATVGRGPGGLGGALGCPGDGAKGWPG